MIWLSAISFILFFYICYEIISRFRFDKLTTLALGLKVIAGISLGLIYRYYYHGGDTFQYYNESATIINFLLENPDSFLKTYFNTSQLPGLADLIVFHDQPRALLFSKIVSILYLFTGGNYWLMSAYLSVINFLGVHLLVRELNVKFNGVKKASYIAFYFLPTFVFWTSGLLKESLAIGVMAVGIALVIRSTSSQIKMSILQWIGLSISLWLLWELKYFYAALVIPLLASVIIYELIQAKWKVRPVIVLLFFLTGVTAFSLMHYNLDFSRVLYVIYNNYQKGINQSTGPYIVYYHFDGSLYGFLLNMPIALFSGLFRPFMFEVRNLLQFLVGAENLAALILLILSVYRSGLRLICRDPFTIISVIYICSMATLLAFSTPNFGTLSRYKAGFWPFFIFMILILYIQNKKGQAQRT